MFQTGLLLLLAGLQASVSATAPATTPATGAVDVGLEVVQQPAVQYYRELGCTPLATARNTTEPPSGYNCSVLDKLTSDKCYYNGKSYEVNQVLKGEDIGSPCTHECTCHKSHITNRASWQCVQIECPEVFNPPKAGCFSLFKKGSCCAVGSHCPGEEPSPEEEKKKKVVCNYRGRTYVEGQRFDAEDEGCLTCVCKEGFNGTLSEEFCSKIQCDFYLHYSGYIQDGCLPTYYEPHNCCPIPIWRCPKEDDQVIVQKTAQPEESSGPSGGTCKFGKLSLKRGEMLSPSEEDRCVECRCLAPPHPTCLMNTTCYNSNQ